VNEVRIRIQQNLLHDKRDNDYTRLRNASRLLTTAQRNQSHYWARRYKTTKERLAYVLSLSPDLVTAYDALQEFYLILDEKEFLLQRLSLTEWLKTYGSCEIEEVHSAANAVKHHRGYIQNSLKYHKSNSTAEGRNRAIKEIKRNSYGQHSFENFRPQKAI
jgi:transposase